MGRSGPTNFFSQLILHRKALCCFKKHASPKTIPLTAKTMKNIVWKKDAKFKMKNNQTCQNNPFEILLYVTTISVLRICILFFYLNPDLA